jgi:DNA mismatch repair protein MutS
MGSLYDEYEAYVKKAREDYGPSAVVLYRCGQFFEIYSADDGLVDIKTLSDLLNIQVSRRNKAILEVNRTNTLMAGFPMFTLRKFVTLLVQNNYTVVIVDQVTAPPKPKRAITEVISPGTNMDGEVASNNIMAVYIEDLSDWNTGKKTLGVGCAVIDIVTGTSHVFEAYSKCHDVNFALDEVYRIMCMYDPAEVILFGNTQLAFEDILTHLEISTQKKCVHNKIRTYPPDIDKLTYQNHILGRLYPQTGMLSLLEYLDLERSPLATKAFVYIVMFSMKHNPDILTKIERPIIMHADTALQLHFNAAKQLNITNGLANIINTACTAIGKRGFLERLMAPLTNICELNKTYDRIDALLKEERFLDIRKTLGNIYDLPRLMRKMYVQKLNPMEFVYVDCSLNAVREVIEMHSSSTDIEKDIVERVRSGYIDRVDLDIMAKYNLDTIEESFFLKGAVAPEIDKLQEDVNIRMQVFSVLLGKLGPFFKLEYNERDGYYFLITAKRLKEAKFAEEYVCPVGDKEYVIDSKRFTSKPVSSSSSNVKVTHPVFAVVSEKILALRTRLKSEVTDAFKGFMKEFVEANDADLHRIVRYVQDVDIMAAHAHNAVKNRYHRPTIVDKYQGRSFVKAQDMRHPIVEVVNTGTAYVTNDIDFSPENTGMLLFGLNCSGKTTLSKAIALNIIMAQMGSFVPARNMEYFPYAHVFTRIPSGDDLFKALSTFAVEMMELRNILKRADHKSLIVGDEVSHGTEITSGVAIVGAAVCDLTKRGSTFIFATHIHDLVNIPLIKELVGVGLQMCHMSVHFDAESGQLIYDRKLQPGSGSSVYGLEVCKALDMPRDFLDLAYEIRDARSILPEPSRYNKAVFMDQPCQICGEKMQEVHHIHHQAHADDAGFIGETHLKKNAAYNLVAVCSRCHDDIHAQKRIVKGYVQTSQGIVLEHEPGTTNKAFEQHIADEILEYRRKNTSMVKIKNILAEKGHDISLYRINKVIREHTCV